MENKATLILEYATLATKQMSLLGTATATRMTEIEDQLKMTPIAIMAEAKRLAMAELIK